MRIFSKQKDYYDSALAFGVDNTVIFKRKEEKETYIYQKSLKNNNGDNVFNNFNKELQKLIVKYKNKSLFSKFNWLYKLSLEENLYNFDFHLVLFCGKCYPCIQINIFKERCVVEEVFSYDLNDLKKQLESKIGKNKSDLFFNSESNQGKRKEDIISNYFTEEIKEIDFDELHHSLDTPYFILKSNEIEKTPVLKDYCFAKIKDPFMTYQEIESYISGVLGGVSPKPIEISDIHRLEAHGFDKVTSFRKEKTKK